jgi:DNA-binding NtrC family response regulator
MVAAKKLDAPRRWVSSTCLRLGTDGTIGKHNSRKMTYLNTSGRDDMRDNVPDLATSTQATPTRDLLCIKMRYSDTHWAEGLADAGWRLHEVNDLVTAHRLMQEQVFSVGLLVPGKIDDSACAALDAFLRAHRGVEWVGAFEVELLATPRCRDLIVDHLFDHHTVPVKLDQIASTLGHAQGHAALRKAAHSGAASVGDKNIVGNGDAAKLLLRQIQRVAKVDAPVLICGPSGSGKELTAQAIHRYSVRAKGPFVPVNCGAIQATLIQSELFGHVKGAFTGATTDGRGLIEAASGGTLFFDEIGDLSLDLQINLLRFLQEKTINRVGSTKSIQVDARVIAATHVNLEKAVAEGRFREDLFYRLNVVQLKVPSLKERQPDIAVLAAHFFEQFSAEKAAQLKGFSRRAMLALDEHHWPGNVRELLNRVRSAMVMAEGRLISPADLGLEEPPETSGWDALESARASAERGVISVSLQQSGKNVTEAAKHLGVSRMTLYRLMAKHGIRPELPH